ncbi:hypothetical protein Tco_0595115 [Tanacetum coccineum]
MSDLIGGLVFLNFSGTGSLPSGRVDLIGDEDPTDEDGDIGVSVSLGDEIFSEEKESQESNIGDSDNTGGGGKTVGRAIITWGSGLISESEGMIVDLGKWSGTEDIDGKRKVVIVKVLPLFSITGQLSWRTLLSWRTILSWRTLLSWRTVLIWRAGKITVVEILVRDRCPRGKEFLASQGLDQAFFESINEDPFYDPQWVNLFQINENVYLELVHEFFALFEFDASPCRYDPNHLGVRFRLGGEQREISLLELGWRVGLYSKRQSRESATLSGLRKGVTVKANHLLLGFWPTIGDGGFNIRNTKVTAIRDPKVKLSHHCIATTIVGTNESTHRITETDLFYLYCIYFEGVVCALSVEPSLIVFKKKSLISMGVIMELHNGACFWPITREVEEEDEEDDETDEAAGGDVGNEGVGGSVDMYRNISQGDWQVRQARWIDQHDEH